MRLVELFSNEPRKTSTSSASFIDKLDYKTRSKPVGAGSYSTARFIDSPKRQNEITKVGHKMAASRYDGYREYITAVHAAEQAGVQNPYFPRIHSLKTYTSADGQVHYVVKMEKLVKLFAPEIADNTELITSLCRQMFIDPGPVSWQDVSGMADLIDRAAANNDTSNIKDKNLIAAIDLINKIHNKNINRDSVVDTHTGNLMWRITGTMPQLVILDPLA